MNDDQVIRVLRLIEYEYNDVETMEADMARWSISSPPNAWNSGMRMRSSHLPPTVQNRLLEEPQQSADAVNAICAKHGLVISRGWTSLGEPQCPVPGCEAAVHQEGQAGG